MKNANKKGRPTASFRNFLQPVTEIGAGTAFFFGKSVLLLAERDGFDEKCHIPPQIPHRLEPLLVLFDVLFRIAVDLVPIGA